VALSGLHKASPGSESSSDVSNLELLAHYELADSNSGNQRSGFAVLLELSECQLTLEADVAFCEGDTLDINIFLPGSGTKAGRTEVSLCCQVAQCHNQDQLRYGARVSRIGEASKDAIQKLHTERSSGGKA
jgi:hypothetical protein